ncbi:MAG: hypothetical protein U9N04_01940 [Patescibacteria group bacterium]|nr:hypothetical protein [Patescibacteria group bacterium]
MTNFLKNNQEKFLLLLGFVLVFSAGFSSGYFFFQEQDSNEYNITIEEPSQDCKNLFNAEPIKEYIVSDFNSSSQVKGEQSKSDSVTLQNKAGMFVASKNSKIYHLPDCQYAQRIKDTNKIWFKSAKEAREAGYSPHSCVK